MPVTITIHGDTAAEALKELQTFANGEAKRYVPNTGERPGTVEAGNVEGPRSADIKTGNESETLSVPIKLSTPPDSEPQDGAEPEVDSAGVPFDPDLHTGTLKKDGTWRVKKGKADEAAALTEEVAEKPGEAGNASSDGIGESGDEVDEFAAFKEAAAEVPDPVEVPDRTWTDADLGQLCNDAAVKLGNPTPIKELIAKYVPEGEVAHSRNIPNEQREAFAQEVEAIAGIEYAG